MIIILEGTNGVGKTTYAKSLAKNLGFPVYCPFRAGDKNIHRGGKSVFKEKLTDYRVPYKTHVDDLYVADFIGSVGANIILDRSLPSAIAYGNHLKDRWVPDDTNSLLSFWQSLFQNEKVLYVWLFAPYDISNERSKQRLESFWPLEKEDHACLEEEFKTIHDKIMFPKLAIDTGWTLFSRGVEKIERILRVVEDDE